MPIQFYNSLTNSVEPFRSIEQGKVRMYSCGPTVYAFAHIGNFRSFLFADLIRRFLEVSGFELDDIYEVPIATASPTRPTADVPHTAGVN